MRIQHHRTGSIYRVLSKLPAPSACPNPAKLGLAKAGLRMVVLAITIVGMSTACEAAKRVALVVATTRTGTSRNYARRSPMRNAIASALRNIGFTVIVAENQDRQSMSQALHAFSTSSSVTTWRSSFSPDTAF